VRVLLVIVLWLLAVPAFPAPKRAVETADAGTNAPAVDSVEKELQKIMADDDAAAEEVDRWIREGDEFASKGAASPRADLGRRIRERFAPVRKAYEEFLRKHPENSKARVAYASFLGDMKDEEGAQDQLETALKHATNNPAIYNNLANIYGHIGPVKKAFEFYAKAIELNPREPVYYHNFGTTVYLFRQDAMEFYNLNEHQVFEKAFALYSNAFRLDPENFPLASDIAQTYYGIRPLRTEEALKAWTNALNIARDEIEREGVYVHFARIKVMAGRLAEAQVHLNAVTNEMYTELKRRVSRNLVEKQDAARTNGAPLPAVPEKPEAVP
jgi:tetratricopeptide (TPR) repeat protein